MNRRQFCAAAFAGMVALPARQRLSTSQESVPPTAQSFVPCRAITRGPKFHWFGYYDKLQFDPNDRYALSNQVDFEHRSPRADDEITIGMVDLHDNDRWIELGTSRAWCWQQGCMLQWRPCSATEVIWNDRVNGEFVCRLADVETHTSRTISRPVYTVSPDGRWALSLDFARVNNMRPGYGYAGVDDPQIDIKAPQDSGIWRVDLDSGKSDLIVSLAKIADLDQNGQSLLEYWNYFNHLLINTDGTRFIFLHRWREQYDPRSRRGGGFKTRMFTCNADGSELFLLDPSGHTSHFIWRDSKHVCAWSRPSGKESAFYLFKDRSREIEPVGAGKMTVNGHNTYVPNTDNQWILCDTYPQGKQRLQTPFLYHVPSHRKVELGHFHLPEEYRGEWRCDTHPRTDHRGRQVVIDSPHGGNGRQLWLLDISEVIGL